jgi:hypothetical protein
MFRTSNCTAKSRDVTWKISDFRLGQMTEELQNIIWGISPLPVPYYQAHKEGYFTFNLTNQALNFTVPVQLLKPDLFVNATSLGSFEWSLASPAPAEYPDFAISTNFSIDYSTRMFSFTQTWSCTEDGSDQAYVHVHYLYP